MVAGFNLIFDLVARVIPRYAVFKGGDQGRSSIIDWVSTRIRSQTRRHTRLEAAPQHTRTRRSGRPTELWRRELPLAVLSCLPYSARTRPFDSCSASGFGGLFSLPKANPIPARLATSQSSSRRRPRRNHFHLTLLYSPALHSRHLLVRPLPSLHFTCNNLSTPGRHPKSIAFPPPAHHGPAHLTLSARTDLCASAGPLIKDQRTCTVQRRSSDSCACLLIATALPSPIAILGRNAALIHEEL